MKTTTVLGTTLFLTLLLSACDEDAIDVRTGFSPA